MQWIPQFTSGATPACLLADGMVAETNFAINSFVSVQKSQCGLLFKDETTLAVVVTSYKNGFSFFTISFQYTRETQ